MTERRTAQKNREISLKHDSVLNRHMDNIFKLINETADREDVSTSCAYEDIYPDSDKIDEIVTYLETYGYTVTVKKEDIRVYRGVSTTNVIYINW